MSGDMSGGMRGGEGRGVIGIIGGSGLYQLPWWTRRTARRPARCRAV